MCFILGNEEIESRHLVPGDLIVLTGKRFFLPCDCILLRGNCIVNEGMLTGNQDIVMQIILALFSETITVNS